MLTGALLSFVSLFVIGFMQLFPQVDVALPEVIVNSWNLVTTYALEWNTLIPVVDMFVAFSIYVTAWSFVFLWYIVRWLISVIRA